MAVPDVGQPTPNSLEKPSTKPAPAESNSKTSVHVNGHDRDLTNSRTTAERDATVANASTSASVASDNLNAVAVSPVPSSSMVDQPASSVTQAPVSTQTHLNGAGPSDAEKGTHNGSVPSAPSSDTKSDNTLGPHKSKVTPAANGSSKPSSSTVKPSLFAKIFMRLVPCIHLSPSAHDLEPDAIPTKPTSNSSATPEFPRDEKQAATVPAKISSPGPVQNGGSVPPSGTSQPGESLSLTVPPPHTDISSTDPPVDDVLLPPTPTTLLRPEEETEGVTSGAVQPPGSTGENNVSAEQQHPHDTRAVVNGSGDGEESLSTSSDEEDDVEDGRNAEVEDEEDRLIMNGGAGIPIGPDGVPRPLLPPIAPQHAGRKCLVLDLDETLVHSSFKSVQQADYVVPVEIEYHWHNVYVIKRPGVDNFLKKMGEIYEVVVFTASLSKYADPVLDKLDIHQVVTHRLFRESCYNHRGNYVKDLSQLGRPIGDTIILDNSPASYIFHPNNAVPVSSWFNDPHDTELTDLVPFLTDLATVDDVRGVLDGAR
ncbi:hypothetical protein HGRIS_002428 [Hohenbuehelia grisea]|uniref:FCP1 homology domain-containing protein n=1 Tax=Hohenbuehelia grisea TaxID=104357 RepID=A0ABR3JKF4_9AGAR